MTRKVLLKGSVKWMESVPPQGSGNRAAPLGGSWEADFGGSDDRTERGDGDVRGLG